MYDRWAVDENWALTKPAFFGALPPGCATWSPRWRAAGNSGPCAATASAATLREIYALGCADLTALSDFLADKPFFLGAEPTALDATA